MPSKFTSEEKQFIQQCKFRLNEEEVPRAEWPKIIQQDLYYFRKKQNQMKRKNSDLGKWWSQVKKRFQKFFFKILMKMQGLNSLGESDEILDILMEQMELKDEITNSSEITVPNDSSYIISNHPEKIKKQEVVFEDD